MLRVLWDWVVIKDLLVRLEEVDHPVTESNANG